MNFATPISQLASQNNQPQMNQSQDATQRSMPVENVSYSDILQNMKSEMNNQPPQLNNTPIQNVEPVMQQQQQQQQQYAPQQQYTHGPQLYSRSQEQKYRKKKAVSVSSSESCESYDTHEPDNSLQTDVVMMFLLTFMVQLPSVQKMISSRIPSMYDTELNQISLIGVFVNASFVVAMWIISRKVASKYMKGV